MADRLIFIPFNAHNPTLFYTLSLNRLISAVYKSMKIFIR